MAKLWNDERILHTWVTNDSESAIGLTIRKLVDMRDTLRQNDPTRSDIRDMRSIMSELKLESKGSGVVMEETKRKQEDVEGAGGGVQVLDRFRLEDLKDHEILEG